ncbi:DNA polymerase III subunit alpha [Inquilinus sp. OTU3971]|uniref:DNA polymerase III subunit alpha n=1 Tax=Inquilinus sp. OTU3971 TaxID=3043855 RepID=UPI00313AF150
MASLNHALSVRSHFSLGESTMSVDTIVETAKTLGLKSVALTDTMTVSGMIDFAVRAKKAEIKPIIGVRLRMVDDIVYRPGKGEKFKQAEHFVKLYARSDDGLKRIFRLLTLANAEPNFYRVPRLAWAQLLAELDTDALVVTLGDAQSALAHRRAREIARNIFDAQRRSNVFLELCPIATPLFDRQNRDAIQLHEELSIPLVVSLPAFYAEGDADARDVLQVICDGKGAKLGDTWALKPYVRDLHMLGDKAFYERAVDAAHRARGRFPALPLGRHWSQALANVETLVESIGYVWEKMPVALPAMAEDEDAVLRRFCVEGWRDRFTRKVFDHQPDAAALAAAYKPRLLYELDILKRLKFAGYFLLVRQIVQWAKSNGIAVGPGRGSVGGSLVGYLIGITDVDPIRFDLLFERFINPERLDLPDADLDFMSERRHEVIDYLTETFGKDRVAGISNYTTMAAASAVRDVARVSDLDPSEYSCTKLVPKEHGQPVSLAKAAELVPDIAKFRDAYRGIWSHATKLEGCMRSLGRHAAGVVVGGVPLEERAVVERREGEPTINWDKRVAEDMGLVKLDVLGLTTLDLLDRAKRYIWKRHAKKVDLLELPLDDEKTLANFAAAKTVGVFQFESGGMRKLLKDLGREGITFDDVAAATALYRPGPMDAGLMDQYVAVKGGMASITFDHPSMENALKDTFGVMVYQEQVMQVSRDFAGFTMPEADKLRKAMGKKLPEEMAKMRDKFVAGAVATSGVTAAFAGEIFDKIEKFAGYGFNKSHAVAYTLISFQSMWVKTYYPVEFFAAALTVLKEDKLAGLLHDAAELGIKVLPPDINISSTEFEILNDTTLVIPFNRIKGISDNTSNAILAARVGGQFTSMADLTARVERKRCNIRHMASLDKVGAFARIEAGQLAATHPDRLRDQVELLPGLVSDHVPIRREMSCDALSVKEIKRVVLDYMAPADAVYCKPLLGSKPRFMVVSDCPTWSEEQKGQFTAGASFEFVSEALALVGLTKQDAYWTGLLKRPKKGKMIEPFEIAGQAPFLDREIEILKPPVIVCLGSASVKHFVPDVRGNTIELAGNVVFDKTLDANIVIGFNPAQIAYDPDKMSVLEELFVKITTMVSDL